MLKLTCATASALLAVTWAAAAHAASLTVTVTPVRNAQGHVSIGICDKAQFLSDRCTYHAIVSAHPGAVTTTIADVAPGLYAVAAYHDETDAGHLRHNLLGIPRDGAGFSRNPKLHFGPPRFAQCAVRVGQQDGAVTVTLRYP